MLLDIVLIQYPLPIGMALKEQCLHATCIACKLPEQQHQLADSLQQMIILAEMDDLMGDYKDAKEVLKKLVLDFIKTTK